MMTKQYIKLFEKRPHEYEQKVKECIEASWSSDLPALAASDEMTSEAELFLIAPFEQKD